MQRSLFLYSSLIIAGSLPAQLVHEQLDINDVRMRVHSDGLIGTRGLEQGLGFFVPQADGTSPLYAAGLWIAGVDGDGVARAAALTYGLDHDLYPGPLAVGTAAITPQVSGAYDRVWKVEASDVLLHHSYILCLNDPDCDEQMQFPGHVIPPDLMSWPAMGDVQAGQAQYLAPFMDNDADGIYQPTSGDHPCVPGDQALYLIHNDNTAPHGESGGLPMGLEIHMMPFSYTSAGPAMDETVFIHYRIINRSDTTYNEVFLGMFADIDIGCPNDDFIGSDVGRNLMFGYNWSDVDTDCLGAMGYGLQPPAFGVVLLKGPAVDANGLDDAPVAALPAYNGSGFGDGVVDNERHGMSGMMYFNREGPNATTDPQQTNHYHNYLRSHWKDGLAMTYGGNGYSTEPAAVPARFMYPWSTDMMGVGTSGTPMPDWREEYPTPAMPDRRGVLSSGPFTMAPGAEQDILLAFVYARAGSGGAEASVEALKLRVDSVRTFAQTIPGIMAPGLMCDGLALGMNDTGTDAIPLRIRPNPATSQLTVLSGDQLANGVLRIFDGRGVMVLEQRIAGPMAEVDVRGLALGMYHIRMETGTAVSHGRFVKE